MAEDFEEVGSGNNAGMIIASYGSKWENFAGSSTEITGGISADFLTGLEYSSKMAGVLDFNYGATVEFTQLRKYEFIDTQGFMYDNEGLQYFGETQNITASKSFFVTAGLNPEGVKAYAACEKFVVLLSRALLLIHTIVNVSGLSMSVVTATTENSEDKGLIAANNIPLMVAVLSVFASLITVSYEASKLFLKAITCNSAVQPNASIFGSATKLFTGLSSVGGYTQITQSAPGLITIGAATAPEIVPSRAAKSVTDIDFMFTSPPDTALLTIDGAGTITAKAPIVTTEGSGDINLTATSSCTILCGATKIAVSGGLVTVTSGTTQLTLTSTSIMGTVGATKLTMTDASLSAESGPSSFVLNGSGIKLVGPTVTIEGALSTNGANLSVASS